MKKLLLLLLLLPSLARAQATAQTIVTGTIVDPVQVPYYPATVTACLFPVTVDPTVDGVHVNPNQGANYCIGPAQTSPTGFFTMALFPNANIFNAGNNNGTTQWQFTVVSAGSAPPAGKGPQTFYLTITIAGTSQNISTQLNANAPLQLNSGGGGGNGNVIGTGTANNVSCWMNANAIQNCPDLTDPSGAPIIAAPLQIVSGTGPTGFSMQEGTPANCLTPAAGRQIFCSINSPDSLVLSSNGGAYVPIGGSGSASAGPSGTIQASNGAGGFQVSSMLDNGTNVTVTEPFVASSSFTTPDISDPGTGSITVNGDLLTGDINTVEGGRSAGTYISGATLLDGQLVKFSGTLSQIIPATTADTGNVILGVTEGISGTVPSGTSVLVNRSGNGGVLLDNAGSCSAGEPIVNSTTVGGDGHCTASPGSAQVVGEFINDPGNQNIDIYPLVNVAGGGGGSGTIVSGTAGQPAIYNRTTQVVSSMIYLDASAVDTTVGHDICQRISTTLGTLANNQVVFIYARPVLSTEACSVEPFAGLTATGTSGVIHLAGVGVLNSAKAWKTPGYWWVEGEGRNTTLQANSGFADGSNFAVIGDRKSDTGITSDRFDTGFRNMSIDCNGVVGITQCVWSETAQEQAGLEHVLVKGCSTCIQFAKTANATPQNWHLDDLEVYPANVAAAIGIDVDGGSSSMKTITDVTVLGKVSDTIGLRINNARGGSVIGLHCEDMNDCVLIGDAGNNYGTSFSNISGHSDVTNVIAIGNGGTQKGLAFSGLARFGATNLINDSYKTYLNQQDAVPFYSTGDGTTDVGPVFNEGIISNGPVVISTMTGTTCLQQIAGVVTSTGSACASATPPAGTAGQLQYNNSGSFGANTWTTNGSTSISAPTNGTLNLSAGSATAGFFLPTAAGAAPTGAGRLSYNSTSNCPVFGNGSTTVSLCGGGTPTFGSIASGTNTTAAMVLGSGSSLTFTGGTNNASSINGVTVTGVPLSGYVPTATSGSAATWQASGGGGISGLTTGFLPKASSTTTVANSLCDEGITTANVFTCTDTGGMALPSGNLSVGSLTGKHAIISATDGSYSSYQADGVTRTVPSIIGAIGTSAGAGTGLEGISWNADNLPHGYIGGFDMGAPPIILLSVSGTNTYVSASPVGILQKGQMYCFDPVISSTNVAPTMNVNSLGAITITKNAGSALVSGDLIAAHMSCMEYNGTTFDLLNPAVSSGSSITGLTTNGNVYAASSTTLASSTPPTVNGQYNCGYTVTASTAVPPTCPQVGLSGRAITGAATTDTVLYNDNATVVNHDQAASGAINETLPTATTLGNANFVYSYANHSAQTDTITPTTWTIQSGSNIAALTLSVPSGAFVRIKVDPNSATNWLADCSGCSSVGLGDPGGNGIVSRTALGVTINRTITGTAPITVTNGTGVSGNPTIAATTVGTDTGLATAATISTTAATMVCSTANGGVTTTGCATFAAPGAIGGTTPAAGTFTTLTGRTSVTAGVVGTTAGVVNLSGNTSGTATLTAPAVAGTATNPIISSNAITIPLGPVTATIASGTSAMGTGAITTGTCATVVTTSATGVATTDTIQYTPNTDPTAVTGYGPSASGSLYIWAYPTANNVNFKVCNNTSGSITPSALTLNWRVSR